jgi:predicted nuclease of predicted toxin-antitoxin system
MKTKRRPFLKQKPILYFDENVPMPVVDHFRKGSRWKKKVKVLSAIELGNTGKSDDSHFAYCSRYGYTLVTLDEDFSDDSTYPFGNGTMHGIVMIKETKGNVQNIRRALANLLHFIQTTPYPKLFLAESKFTVSGEGCVMRGRDVKTREVKTLQIVAGRTKAGEVWKYFSYAGWS